MPFLQIKNFLYDNTGEQSLSVSLVLLVIQNQIKIHLKK